MSILCDDRRGVELPQLQIVLEMILSVPCVVMGSRREVLRLSLRVYWLRFLNTGTSLSWIVNKRIWVFDFRKGFWLSYQLGLNELSRELVWHCWRRRRQLIGVVMGIVRSSFSLL